MEKDLAIVADGGGMKCSYSAGVLCGLAKHHNLREPEFLIGSSGSTGSLAYYLAQQYAGLENMWINLLVLNRFIAFKRLNKIMDIDYLVDEVFKKQEPLGIERLRNSKTKLFISATEYDSGNVKFFTNHMSGDIFEYLRASKAIPVVFNKKVRIEGIDYIDGAISAPLAVNIKKIISKGVKNIIVIQDGEVDSRLTQMFWKGYSFFVNKGLRSTINRKLKQGDSTLLNFPNVNILFVSPSKKLKISFLDNNRENLKNSFGLGLEDAKSNKEIKTFLDSLAK